MKNLLILTCLLISSLGTNAATSISTPTVSGNWTLAGSPYKIYNDITISSGQSLVIDPGVTVLFQGSFNILVAGSLHAVGTFSSPIIFDVQDTSGWHIDTSGASIGGWRGIQFETYLSTTPDISEISYCNFSHLKYGNISLNRGIHFSYCNFSNNRAGITVLNTGGIGGHEIDHCEFFNNIAHLGSMVGLFDTSAEWYVHDNNFYDNKFGNAGVLRCMASRMLFSKNNVHHNSPLDTILNNLIIVQAWSNIPSTVVFAENMIYENRTNDCGAITCCFSIVDFNRNYICNNSQLNASHCGLTDGGGALFLIGSSDYAGTSLGYGINSVYTIRNNIFANNYSASWGGAIYIYSARTLIANNVFVNNKAPRSGAIDCCLSDTSTICIRNNIFEGNVSTDSVLGSAITTITIFNVTRLKFDHNYTDRPLYKDLFVNVVSGYPLSQVNYISDTNTNITGTSPGFVNPTLTADHTESAISSDFNLLMTSPCINKGFDSATVPSSADFAGNRRIHDTVDIGAYEFGAPLALSIPAVEMDTVFKNCCNLIIRYPQPATNTKDLKTSYNTIDIQTYPNPATSVVFITMPEPNGKIEIRDITGKLQAEKLVSTSMISFDVQPLPRGIYFATWSLKGNRITKKLVLE